MLKILLDYLDSISEELVHSKECEIHSILYLKEKKRYLFVFSSSRGGKFCIIDSVF